MAVIVFEIHDMAFVILALAALLLALAVPVLLRALLVATSALVRAGAMPDPASAGARAIPVSRGRATGITPHSFSGARLDTRRVVRPARVKDEQA
jgi:acid phosphatase family membrane protein YuiD